MGNRKLYYLILYLVSVVLCITLLYVFGIVEGNRLSIRDLKIVLPVTLLVGILGLVRFRIMENK